MRFIARARWKWESSVAEDRGVGMSVAWRPPAVGFLCAGGPLFFAQSSTTDAAAPLVFAI
jgi:hypothetical protein